MITGTLLTDEHAWPWVEACHIDVRENEQGFLLDNSADNGLFLRSDLQRLFTSRRMTIDPLNGTVHFRRTLLEDQTLIPFYQELEGKVCALWQQVPENTPTASVAQSLTTLYAEGSPRQKSRHGDRSSPTKMK